MYRIQVGCNDNAISEQLYNSIFYFEWHIQIMPDCFAPVCGPGTIQQYSTATTLVKFKIKKPQVEACGCNKRY